MKKSILITPLLFFIVSCNGNGSSSKKENGPTDTKKDKVAWSVEADKSASEIRRAIASQNADTKNFSKNTGVSAINNDRSELVWSCDREKIPRTCCYYLLNNGGGIFGSPSCVEENH